jgi:hypothetical protein
MFFIIINALHVCFGRAFRPSSGAYKSVCAALGIVMLSCCLPLVWTGWFAAYFIKMPKFLIYLSLMIVPCRL